MLAALTLTISLGWWILPVLVACVAGVLGTRAARSVSSGWGVLVFLTYGFIPLLAIMLYLLAALLFGIR